MEDDIVSEVFSELMSLGVKIPKIRKLKSKLLKQNSQEKFGNRSNKMFGVSLCDQEWVLEDGIALPRFVSLATTYLRRSALNEIGLFRKGGSIARQKALRLKLENGESFETSEPNDIASLLKQWLRELPEPLIPTYLHELFIKCQNIDDDKRIAAVLLSCHLLPAEHLQTLKHLLIFLADIAANCDKNKMGFNNLAVIMAPNIFVLGSEAIDKSSNNVVQLHASLMQILIENAEKIGVIPNAQGALLESELSSDALDFSPKTKKKRRSGKVQDLLSGIRKLVGQNSTPAASRKETPDVSQSSRTSVSRSASKRKAEGDQQSMSAVKKQAILKHEWKNGAAKTPEGKIDFDTPANSDKSCRTHTRKRSFGLLRRKERRKKSRDPKDTAVNVDDKSVMHAEKDSGAPEIKIAEITSKEMEMSPLLSQSDIDGIIAGSSGLKNSVPRCFLEVPNEELNKYYVTPSGSTFNVTPKKQSLSPYFLRSRKISEGSISEKTSPIELRCASAEKQISRKRKSLFVERDQINVSSLSDGYPELAKIPQRNVSSISADHFNFYVTPQKQRLIRNDKNESFRKAVCASGYEDDEAYAFNNSSAFEIPGKNKLKSNASQIKQTAFTVQDTLHTENGLKQSISKCLNESASEDFESNSSPRHGLKRNTSRRTNAAPVSSENLAPILPKRAGLKLNNSRYSNVNESTSENSAPISTSKQVVRQTSSKNMKTVATASENLAPISLPRKGLRENSSKNIKTAATASENLAPISSIRNELKRNSSRLSKTSTSETKNMRKSSIKRQEAFIVKRSNSTRGENTVTQVKGLENNANARFAPTNYKKSEKVSNEIKRNSSRKGSIVRGRPNTVKTGLPTDLNIRLSNESGLSSSGKVNYVARISSGSDVSLEINTEKSLLKVNIASKINISHNDEVQRFPFSPNISSNTFLNDNCLITPNAKICDSIFKDDDSNISLEMNVNQNSTESKMPKKSRLRMSSNSDSKIHRPKDGLKVIRTNSFPNPAKKELELSSISQALSNVLTIDNIKENIDTSSNLCFTDRNKSMKTSKNVDVMEEKSEVWVSGKNFLDKLKPEEEVFNKRESIAMILRNKPGHVQAKVCLYDCQRRNPAHSTPQASKTSTAVNACFRTYSLQNELPHQMHSPSSNKSLKRNASENLKLESSKGCDSTPRLKNKTKSKTPLPPPPKFKDSDFGFTTPIPSYPLKELTNINSKLESSINTEKNEFTTPVKNKDEDMFQTPEVFPSPINPKRKSFSGHTPHKISKVSRSESSPVIFKNHNKLTNKQSLYKSSSLANTLNDQKLPSDKERSLVFETGSALSFEKLKSDQMLDEWQYEM